MKKQKIAVFVMGLTLPLWGWFAGAILSVFLSNGLLRLISVAVLAIWALMGFFAEDILDDTVQAVFFLNLPLLIVLLIYMVHAFSGGFLPESALSFFRSFFSPFILRFEWGFTFQSIPDPLPQLITAALLVSASVAGCKARRYDWPMRGI